MQRRVEQLSSNAPSSWLLTRRVDSGVPITSRKLSTGYPHLIAIAQNLGYIHGMITIEAGSAVENYARIASLVEEHWQETASHKEIRSLNIPIDRYETLENVGCLLSLFVIDDGEIVGYSINVIAEDLHAADTIKAQNDAIFVKSTHRKTRAGMMLMSATEKAAKDMGASLMIWHAKPGSKLDAILERNGYGVLDVLYSKRL